MNKRNIMLILDFCTAILISLFCSLSGKVDIVPLMTVTMIILYGIDGAGRPAVKASVPALVEPESKKSFVVSTHSRHLPQLIPQLLRMDRLIS